MPRKRSNFVAEKQKKETNRINNKCFLLISLLQIVRYPYILMKLICVNQAA